MSIDIVIVQIFFFLQPFVGKKLFHSPCPGILTLKIFLPTLRTYLLSHSYYRDSDLGWVSDDVLICTLCSLIFFFLVISFAVKRTLMGGVVPTLDCEINDKVYNVVKNYPGLAM